MGKKNRTLSLDELNFEALQRQESNVSECIDRLILTYLTTKGQQIIRNEDYAKEFHAKWGKGGSAWQPKPTEVI